MIQNLFNYNQGKVHIFITGMNEQKGVGGREYRQCEQKTTLMTGEKTNQKKKTYTFMRFS